MNLATTQLLSLITKTITTVLGIIQALLVVHFLSKPEFGLVGLVTAIGSVIGVTQHLGVVDGAIREIAVLKRKEEIGKIFWVSHLMRQLVTLPLSLGLIVWASFIAQRIYNLPEIAGLIQLYAASLVLQGLQDVLGATLTGMKKFISLYIVQIGTALLNIFIFAYGTWRYATTGYFWAIIATTSVMVVWYSFVIARHLRHYLRLPTWSDITFFAKRLWRVSVYMYAARILFVVWQRLPLLVLGIVLAKEQLADLAFSLTFGSKLTILAMALSEVNLSWMSTLFAHNQREFQRVVTRNMQRLLFLLLLLTASLIFFAPEILQIPILLKYAPAQNLIIVMTVAFFIYALVDIGTSSVFVAADQPRWRALLYALMTGVTGAVVGWLVLFRPDPFLATLGVLLGAGAAYVTTVTVAWRHLKIALLTRALALALGLLIGCLVWLLSAPALPWRILVFIALAGYAMYEVRRSELLPRPFVTRHPNKRSFMCLAGAFYDAPTWTNRQHVMSRLAQQYPVFYVEPRVWIVRYLLDHWRAPRKIIGLIKRIIGWQKAAGELYVKAQWNLIPGSREYNWIARCNHWLNRWNVILTAKLLGFGGSVVWLYDTEGAEYLNAFPNATIVYDCVDDHAVQAGPDRNSERVRAEERAILRRANVVTVTSRHLYNQKKLLHGNVHLVEQAADVKLFSSPGTASLRLASRGKIIGSVGTLDSYKYDFDLIEAVARSRPEWHMVFVGEPAVERRQAALTRIESLPNVTLIGIVPRHLVPTYVHQFDVCMIPYSANDYNRSSFPLKFWEFMATGKPIVVSGLPELAEYQDLIGYATNAADFVQAIQKALAAPAPGRDRRMALAQEHSWEKRVAALLRLLEE